MANPNLINTTSIFGKTAYRDVTTVQLALVTNPMGSDALIKVNSILISDTGGFSSGAVTVTLTRGADVISIATTVVVPNSGNKVIVDKNTPIFLEEGDVIKVSCTSNSTVHAICSYEEIS
jgi:hypothetical protein